MRQHTLMATSTNPMPEGLENFTETNLTEQGTVVQKESKNCALFQSHWNLAS